MKTELPDKERAWVKALQKRYNDLYANDPEALFKQHKRHAPNVPLTQLIPSVHFLPRGTIGMAAKKLGEGRCVIIRRCPCPSDCGVYGVHVAARKQISLPPDVQPGLLPDEPSTISNNQSPKIELKIIPIEGSPDKILGDFLNGILGVEPGNDPKQTPPPPEQPPEK